MATLIVEFTGPDTPARAGDQPFGYYRMELFSGAEVVAMQTKTSLVPLVSFVGVSPGTYRVTCVPVSTGASNLEVMFSGVAVVSEPAPPPPVGQSYITPTGMSYSVIT